MRWLTVSDASLANLEDGKSQGGYVVAATDTNLALGEAAPFSLITWKSKKVRRVVKASLGSEAQALDDALGELEWVRAIWSEMTDPRANLSEPTLRYGPGESVVVVRRLGEELPSYSTIDARGLYDHLARPSGSTGSSSDRRTKVDIGVICESLRSVSGSVHWLPNQIMIADCLTKKSGNTALMRFIMEKSLFAIRAESVQRLLQEFCSVSQMQALNLKAERESQRSARQKNLSQKKVVNNPWQPQRPQKRWLSGFQLR